MKANNKTTRKVSRSVKMISAITAVVVVIAIVAVMLLNALPSNILEFDMTENELYGITSLSERMLDNLEDDLEIAVIIESSSLDEHFTKFIEKYTALSPHLSLVWVDPVLYPSLADEYGEKSNTVVVKNLRTGTKSTFELCGFEGQDSAALLYDYTSYYIYGTMNLSSMDAEGLLARAITAVTSESTHTVYYLYGHNEAAMPTTITAMLDKANYGSGYVDLLVSGIPDDCELLIINAPENDISTDELDILQRWMLKGGKIFLIIDDSSLTNFSKLLLTYGIQMENGRLADTQNYYSSYLEQFGYYCFYPMFNEDSELCNGISSNGMVIGAVPLSLVTPERRSSWTETFMSSSTSGVNYNGQEEGDITAGTYYVGVTAMEDLDDNTSSRLTVISSAYFDSENLLSNFSSLANSTIIMNCININFDGVETVTIPARSVTPSYNSFTSTGFYSIFFIALVPLAFLIFGFVFWLKRRKQ